LIDASARLYIQVRETGEIVQLDDFISVETMNSLSGDSNASVSIVNAADKWYNFRSTKDRRQTDIAQLLADAYKRPLFRDINEALNAKYKEAIKMSRASDRESALEEIASLEEYMIFDLSYRMWVDFRGRDNLYEMASPSRSKLTRERWYAGFTGIITALSEGYAPGKDAAMSITANSMMQLFKTTKAVTEKGYNPLFSTPADTLSSFSAMTNSFAEYQDGGAIISFLIQLIERTFHAPNDGSGIGSIYYGSKFWNLPDVANVTYDNGVSSPGAPHGGLGQAPSDPTKIKWNQKILSRNYEGYGHMRPEKGILGLFSDPNFLNNLKYDGTAYYKGKKLRVKKSDIIKFISKSALDSNVNNPNLSQYLVAKYGIDTAIKAVSQSGAKYTNPYQQAIKAAFNFDSPRISCNTIMAAVAGVMNYNVFFDAAGNLIYQKSRYDDFPGTAPDVDYDADVPDNRGAAFLDGDGDPSEPLFKKLGKGTFKDDKGNRNPGLKYHGRNYIIGDESLLGWVISKNEQNVVTNVAVPSAANNLTISQELQSEMAGVFFSADLTRRFGNRFLTASPIITDSITGIVLAETVAEGLMRRANQGLEVCSMTFNTRPDFQLGRTVFLAERRKLYYLDVIQNRFVPGQEFKTTLTGKYGHPPTDPIGDPWQLLLSGDNWMTMTKKNLKDHPEVSSYSYGKDIPPLEKRTLPLDDNGTP